MKLIIPTLLTLAATTSNVQAWSGRFGSPSYFSTAPLVIQTPSSALKRQRALANRMFEQTDRMLQITTKARGNRLTSSPHYQVIETDEKFELSIDVPGVKPEDMTITLDDGHLSIRGQRMASTVTSDGKTEQVVSSKFSQTFSLDPSVDIDKFSANLNNGVLVVTAPKDLKKLGENIRKIPITTVPSAATSSNAEEDVQKHSAAVASGVPVETAGTVANAQAYEGESRAGAPKVGQRGNEKRDDEEINLDGGVNKN